MKFNNHMTRSVALLAVIESIQAARLQALTGIEWFDIGDAVDYVTSGDILDDVIESGSDFVNSTYEFTSEMNEEFLKGDWVEKYGDQA